MRFIQFVQTQLKRPVVAGAVVVIVAFVVIASIKHTLNKQAVEEATTDLRMVEVTTAAKLSQSEELSLIGTVRAFTEAQITTERAGRVTSVSAQLGGTVGAGQTIATLENASEQAAVLQAQGVYEAALASARQSGISVDSAENSLENTLRSAYNTTNEIVRNDIDDLFANPDAKVPGLKINGKGQTQTLNAERVVYQNILPEWQTRVNTYNSGTDLLAESAYTKAQINRTISFLDSFITILPDQDTSGTYSAAQIETLIAEFTARRGTLLSLLSAIQSAESSLETAREAANSNSAVSVADAQVKQALGSLRAAQANLAKTILRSPISGTVNSLDIKIGDFVGAYEKVAQVANNNALEVVTYVGDLEKEQLVVGEEVRIEGSSIGVITQIAPAVDAETKKTEVRIATDDPAIKNGDTVRITKTTQVVDSLETIRIPLTAVKFETSDGSIMQVVDGILVQKPVDLGAVRGTSIEVISGLSATDTFVVDVRGLTVGTHVEVIN